jgi:hypothetical protein
VNDSVRKEQAAEEFAELCGVFPTKDSVSVVDGLLTVSSSEGEIKRCIDPPSVDVVFLRNNPFADLTTLKTVLCAQEDGGTSIAHRYSFCSKAANEISVAELGLENSYPEPLTAVDPVIKCDAIVQASGVSNSANQRDFTAGLMIDSAIDRPFSSYDGLLHAISSLKFQSWGFGGKEWGMFLNGHAIMGTDAGTASDSIRRVADIWPACEVAGDCSEFAEMLKATFWNVDGVERGLFHLGALAGTIPGETFSLAVPAYQLSAVAPADEPAMIPLVALYGHGRFIRDGDLFRYDGTFEES